MMKRTVLALFVFGIALGWLPSASAQDSSPAPNAEQLQYFEQKVRPLLVAKCFECHSGSADKLKGGLMLDSRDAILTAETMDRRRTRKPAESLLIKAVHYNEAGMEMPPTGKLKPHEIEVLEAWVGMGAPFPAATTHNKQRKLIDIEAGKRHWAFQPLGEPSDLPHSSWTRQRMDGFILAAQQAQNEHPLEQASSAQLLRRIKFDLLGLPPTIEELEQFASDTRPMRYRA